LKTGLVDAEDDSSVLKKNEPRLYAKLKMKSHTLGMIQTGQLLQQPSKGVQKKKLAITECCDAEAICTSIEL
jgi:hypothetical protein